MSIFLPAYCAGAITNILLNSREEEQEMLAMEHLLLKGENDYMEIGQSEIVEMILVHKNYGDDKWVAKVNDEEIETGTFDECFQAVIQKSKAIEFQVIPCAIDKKYGYVKDYFIVIKKKKNQFL